MKKQKKSKTLPTEKPLPQSTGSTSLTPSPFGRPTLYKDEQTLQQLQQIIDDFQFSNFLECCTPDAIAFKLGVHVDTLYAWAKKHHEFSERMKMWKTKRNYLAMALCIKLPPAVWIFCAKNWLRMSDIVQTEIKASGAYGGVVLVPETAKDVEQWYNEIKELPDTTIPFGNGENGDT